MAIAEIETFAARHGLGMLHPDVQKFLPPHNPERTEQLAQETEAALRTMVEQHRVQEALQAETRPFNQVIRRIAAFHALAYGLSIYQGSLIGYFVDETAKRIHLFVMQKDTWGMGEGGINYDTEVAIHSKDGGLTERHRLGLEDRHLYNLRRGLTMSTRGSGVDVLCSLLPDVVVKPAPEQPRQELFNQLRSGSITYIGELIPTRQP